MLSSVAFASETVTPITAVETTENSSNTATQEEYETLAEEFQDVDITQKNFDRTLMTSQEQALLDEILNIEYQNAVANETTEGRNEDQFKETLENILTGKTQKRNELSRNSAHGTISVVFAASALRVIVFTACMATGVGSLPAALAAKGEKQFRKWFLSIVVPFLIDESKKKLGIKIAATAFTVGVVTEIIRAIGDPADWIAIFFESRDDNSGNRYYEFW